MTQEERFEKAFEICVDVKKVNLNGPVESRIYDGLVSDVSIFATMFPGEEPLTLTKEEARPIAEEMLKKAGAVRFEDPRLAKLDELGKEVALEWWKKLGTRFLQLPLRQFFEVQKHLAPKVFDKAEALGLSCTPEEGVSAVAAGFYAIGARTHLNS